MDWMTTAFPARPSARRHNAAPDFCRLLPGTASAPRIRLPAADPRAPFRSINLGLFFYAYSPSSKRLAQRCHALPHSAASWFVISVPDLVLNSLSTARLCALYTVTNSARSAAIPNLGVRQPMSPAKWPRKQKITNDSN